MDQKVQELIQQAKFVALNSGSGPGVKYPKELKEIVVKLRNEHNLSVKKITKHIPISDYSAREWPKQIENKKSKKVFKKVSINNDTSQLKVQNKIIKFSDNYKFIKWHFVILGLQVFLTSLALFYH